LLGLGCFVDNEYLDLYCSLINDNRATKREKFKTQSHHIIPKCCFSCLKLPIDDSSENKVNLLYSKHILAHYYLCLCSDSTNKQLKYKLENSFLHLVSGDANNKKRIENYEVDEFEQFQEIYEEWKSLNSSLKLGKSSWNKGLTKSTDARVAKYSKPRNFSKEHNKNLSKAIKEYFKTHVAPAKGRKLSDEAKRKLSEAHKGKYYMPKDPEAHSKKMSENSKRYWETHPERIKALIEYNKSRVISEETRRKIALGQKRQEVVMIDDDGNVIHNFISIKDAARYFNITNCAVSWRIKKRKEIEPGRYLAFKQDTDVRK